MVQEQKETVLAREGFCYGRRHTIINVSMTKIGKRQKKVGAKKVGLQAEIEKFQGLKGKRGHELALRKKGREQMKMGTMECQITRGAVRQLISSCYVFNKLFLFLWFTFKTSQFRTYLQFYMS